MAAHATRLTKKQATCVHPVRHVHVTIDERFETCDLCHVIRRAPVLAPWIAEYDAAQPTPPPPPLFADYTPPAPAPAPELDDDDEAQEGPEPDWRLTERDFD